MYDCMGIFHLSVTAVDFLKSVVTDFWFSVMPGYNNQYHIISQSDYYNLASQSTDTG